MGEIFQLGGGGERYAHQHKGLRELIRTKGVHALLWDPGVGKTSAVIDYASLMAVKLQREVKVLVVCPLVAVDTWVMQMDRWASPQVSRDGYTRLAAHQET